MTEGLAQILANGVRDRGADIVFGFPGGGPNLEVVGAAVDAGLRFVLTHGETTACMCNCAWGGVISISNPGQMQTQTA